MYVMVWQTENYISFLRHLVFNNISYYSIIKIILYFRPSDPRMLIALGDTYQNIDKPSEAKKVKASAIFMENNNNNSYEALCVIWSHLDNLKNMKNTHGEVLHLVPET